MDQVTFNTRCAQLARERGLDWREMTFDQRAAIRLELDHLWPKIGPEPGLSRDGLPHRVNDPKAATSVSVFPGGPIVPPDSQVAKMAATFAAAGAARVEAQEAYNRRIKELARERGWPTDPRQLSGLQAAQLRRIVDREQSAVEPAPPAMSPESARAAAAMMEQAHRNAEGGGEYAMRPGVGAGRFDHPAR